MNSWPVLFVKWLGDQLYGVWLFIRPPVESPQADDTEKDSQTPGEA